MSRASPSPRRSAEPPLRRAWFASDFHLHEGDPDGVEAACAFLREAARSGVELLGLLGDVFRAWVGPSSLDERGLAPFFEELQRLTQRGVRVLFVHGNHDFALGAAFAAATGAEVYAGGVEVQLGGQRVRLEHGDAFCIRDHSYHRLHRVLRSDAMRFVYRLTPRSTLRRIAARLNSSASHTTSAKTAEVMDIVDHAVVDRLATGLDVVVCGHVHRARDARLELPDGRIGRLLVLADFERSGSQLHWEGGEWRLHEARACFAPPTPPVIAIDGPAGGGKSAVGRLLSERLGFLRLDSGAIYRAVTEQLLEAGLESAPEAEQLELLRGLSVRVLDDGGLSVNGERIADERLRTPRVSSNVSAVATSGALRRELLGVQRDAVLGRRGLVAEGRDMATVVFPRAAHQVYLDARPEIRAARRLAQNAGEGRDLASVSAALAERDARDSGRAVAPLRAADGAWVLDTSDLSLHEVVERIAERVAAG